MAKKKKIKKKKGILKKYKLKKYKTEFKKVYNFFNMRLKPYRRYRKPIFKIVVTNKRNRVEKTLGYFNPFEIKFRPIQYDWRKPVMTAKLVILNRENTIYWLKYGALPSRFLFWLLGCLGVLKSEPDDGTHYVKKFHAAGSRTRAYWSDLMKKVEEAYRD